jgi:hypothetical protein
MCVAGLDLIVYYDFPTEIHDYWRPCTYCSRFGRVFSLVHTREDKDMVEATMVQTGCEISEARYNQAGELQDIGIAKEA